MHGTETRLAVGHSRVIRPGPFSFVETDAAPTVLRARRIGDVLAQVLEQSGSIEVVTDPAIAVDVVIFRLDGDGQWPAGWAPAPPPNAKLIAVAATGDQGWILLPGESEWSVIRPFGLDQLIREVLAGREYRPLSSPADLPPMR